MSHSAVTVVSAFASGRGVTIGISIPCKVTVELRKQEKKSSLVNVVSKVPDPHGLIKTSAAHAIKSLKVSIPQEKKLVVKVDTVIPTAVGLKSSSAVSVAVTKAIFALFSASRLTSSTTQKILRLSCEASIQSGASLTGAFDDAAACLLGGLVFANNPKFKLLRHESSPDELGSIIKILVPIKTKKLTSALNLSTYRDYKDQSLEAIRFAQKGVLVQAMLLNSIIHSIIHRYSMQPIISSITEGASASGVSGKGPAIFAICPSNKIARNVERRWIEEHRDSKTLTSRIRQTSAG